MNDPLLGPRIKLERAYHHLIDLERTEREFFEQNPCRIIFDTETQPGHKLAKLILDAKPPEIMHVLAGEILYQLRSALDQTAVAFARLSNGPTKPKLVHFPTGDGPKGFKSSCASFDRKNKKLVGNLRYFDSNLRKAIMRTEPYDGGNETLRAVFLMANIDKHMELIAIGASGGFSGIKDYDIIGAFYCIVASGEGNLNDGVVFSDLEPHGTITPSHPNAKIYVSGKITLGDVGPTCSGKPLVPFLRAMTEEVGRAHESFESVLIARGDMPEPPDTVPVEPIKPWRGNLDLSRHRYRAFSSLELPREAR